MKRWLLKLLRAPMSSRRFGLFLCFLGFVWGITLIQLTLFTYQSGGKQEADKLEEEILELSKRYVEVLAKQQAGTLDVPYGGKMTGYDMKKTIAVLLDTMMKKIDSLEVQLAHLKNNTGRAGLPNLIEDKSADKPLLVEGLPDHVDFKGLLNGQMEDCKLTEAEKKEYPHCEGKLAWMQAHWKSDPCYSEYGVDGSGCSFRVYLSEIENWCPLLPGRKVRSLKPENKTIAMASTRKDKEGLMILLRDPGPRHNYEWIRQRIDRMWPKWTNAIEALEKKQDLGNRKQKRILVHLGLLTKQSGFKIAEGASRGGPLGELVQWSDIISSLYVLGHDLTITSEVEQLTAILSQFPTVGRQCQTREKLPIDIIMTDIIGLNQFRKKVKAGYGKFSCLLRIVDSFGTEPSFNYDQYAKTHGMKTQWGMQNLNPQQFYTMFPHTPDNSFMGFVVENHASKKDVAKRNQAVVYGKADYMWQGKKDFLDIVKDYVEVHGTVYNDANKGIKNVPLYVKNHGILSGQELHQLLQESKLFIGLGFPYEGPAPLEAIAQGCVFINPQFLPPHSSANTKFFKGKPTLRELASQHPYTEDYIGRPHVQTVNIANRDEVKMAIETALKNVDEGKVKAYMPYEYTAEGMIQRLHAYVQHQEFCNPTQPLWPPEETVEVGLAQPGQDCKQYCKLKNRICEPAHFKRINKQPEIEKYMPASKKCATVETVEDIYYPAFNQDTNQCLLQKNSMLFSCVGGNPAFTRLCPCRDYIKGQTALCSKCV